MKHRGRISSAEIRKRRAFTAALAEAGLMPVEAEEAEEVEVEIRTVPVQDGRPGPCGKIAYTSRREAEKALNRLIRVRAVQGRSEDIEVRAYGPCDRDVCRGTGVPVWHLTSRKR